MGMMADNAIIMAKEIKYGIEARKALEEGVNGSYGKSRSNKKRTK